MQIVWTHRRPNPYLKLGPCNPTCNEHGFDPQTGREVGYESHVVTPQIVNSVEIFCMRWTVVGSMMTRATLTTGLIRLQMNIAFDTVLAGMAAVPCP